MLNEPMIVSGEHYILPEPNAPLAGRRALDLCIACNVDRAAFVARNAGIISEPGKPPGFAPEIAAPRAARIDIGASRG